MTQLEQARAEIITDQMRQVAQKEAVDAEAIRREVAAGRMVIPANVVHLKDSLDPIGIGPIFERRIEFA